MEKQRTIKQPEDAVTPGSEPTPETAYRIIWQQVEAEHSLINNRLGWYVTSQSFLLTAFGAWVWSSKKQWDWIPELGIPMLGVLTSVAILFPIIGATYTKDKWWDLRYSYIPAESPFGRLIYLQRPKWMHRAGLVVPSLFPVFFLILWLLIIKTR